MLQHPSSAGYFSSGPGYFQRCPSPHVLFPGVQPQGAFWGRWRGRGTSWGEQFAKVNAQSRNLCPHLPGIHPASWWTDHGKRECFWSRKLTVRGQGRQHKRGRRVMGLGEGCTRWEEESRGLDAAEMARVAVQWLQRHSSAGWMGHPLLIPIQGASALVPPKHPWERTHCPAVLDRSRYCRKQLSHFSSSKHGFLCRDSSITEAVPTSPREGTPRG